MAQVDDAFLSLAQILAAVGAAESGSEHPLATAVVSFVKGALGVADISAKISDFRAVPGFNPTKLFSSSLTRRTNKLECFT